MSHQLADPLIDTFKAALAQITNANDRVKLLLAIESRALLLEGERAHHTHVDELERKHRRACEQLEREQEKISEERLRVDQLRRKTASSKFRWATKELDSAVSGLEFSELMVERAEKAVEDSARELRHVKDEGARETRQLRDDARRTYEACGDVLDVIPADPNELSGAPGIRQQFMAVVPVKPVPVLQRLPEYPPPPPPPPPPPSHVHGSRSSPLGRNRSQPYTGRGESLPPPPPPPPPKHVPLPGPKCEIQPAPRPVPYTPAVNRNHSQPPSTRLPSPPPQTKQSPDILEDETLPRMPPRPRYMSVPVISEPERASPPPLPRAQRPGHSSRLTASPAASAQPLLNGDTYRQSAPPRMPQLPPKPASLKSAYRSQRPASLPIAITINNGLETQLAVRRFQTELPRRFLIRVSAPSSADVDEVRRALFGHIWMCVRAMLQESVPGAAKAELIDSTSASCLGAHIDVYLEETGVPAMRMPVDIVGSLKHPVQQDHSLGAAKETNSQGQANIRRLQDGFGGGCDPVAVEQAIKALVHQRIAAEPLSQGVGLVIAAEGMVLAERTDRLGVEVSPLVTFGGMAPHPVAAIGFYVAKALTRLAGH